MSRKTQKSPATMVVIRMLLAIFSLALSLVLAELVVRLVVPRPPSWLDLYERHPVIPTYRLMPNAHRYVDTGETKWAVQTDGRGFRVAASDPEARATCTVLWLGDSYLFGHGVDYDESFAGRIAAANRGIRHLNSGVPGYGPTQYRQTLEYQIDGGVRFDRVVVASYLGNDFHDTQWSKDVPVHDGIIGDQDDLKSRAAKHLHLYRLAAAAWHRIADVRPDQNRITVRQLEDPAAWREPFLAAAEEDYEKELSRIAELATEVGASVSVLLLPTREAVEGLRARAESGLPVGGRGGDPALPLETAKAILNRVGLSYVDVTPALAAFPAEEMFFVYDGHLTVAGSRAVADSFLAVDPLRCGGD